MSRAARSPIAAVGAALMLFLLLALMVVRTPATAADPQPRGTGSEQAAAGSEDKGKPSAAPTTSPQPKSNADMNKGGANNGGDCGAYCSTRDGSASKNGKGDGKASGKPCAGCVGKADNKNPPGQAPDGTDHNNGYECDGNQGVGKTNPAHTGCKTGTGGECTVSCEPEPCVPGDAACPTPCVPSDEDPCGTPAPCVPGDAECPLPTPTPCVPSAEDPCETVAPCVPGDAECPLPTPSPCVPSATDPCDEPDCVPTDEQPCVLPTVIVTPSSTPVVTPSATVTPSVRGVKIVRPGSRTPRVDGGALPRTGAPAPIALLLLLGFGTVVTGIAVTTVTPKSR